MYTIFYFAAVNPYIIHQPVSQLAVPNCVVNFTCIALAFPPPTYGWITPIENRNFNSTTIFLKYEDLKPEFIGDYICTVSSNGVMVRSNTVHLSGMLYTLGSYNNTYRIAQNIGGENFGGFGG